VKPQTGLIAMVAFVCALALSSCHSYRIDAVVENRTGSAIELLEVDYPSASFGSDRLSANAEFRYRFQVRGSGPIKVQYTDAASHATHQISGPDIAEHQEGRIEIILLPAGKAEFHPDLTSHS
jgi:hypothetical protein